MIYVWILTWKIPRLLGRRPTNPLSQLSHFVHFSTKPPVSILRQPFLRAATQLRHTSLNRHLFLPLSHTYLHLATHISSITEILPGYIHMEGTPLPVHGMVGEGGTGQHQVYSYPTWLYSHGRDSTARPWDGGGGWDWPAPETPHSPRRCPFPRLPTALSRTFKICNEEKLSQAGGRIHFCMKRLRTLKSFKIFRSEIKK
jgi:hypothetical protein